MADAPATSGFKVLFEAEGVNKSKFRNDVAVHLRGSHAVSYELPTDEGGIHGGDGSAPYPLAYFTSSLTACVMTQIRAFSKRLGITVNGFTVNLMSRRRSSSRWISPLKGRQATPTSGGWWRRHKKAVSSSSL
jgi:hypothetical protein